VLLLREPISPYPRDRGNSLPTHPWPANYTTVTRRLPTFGDALAVKEVLLRKGHCSF
jgi:hypothetical protein